MTKKLTNEILKTVTFVSGLVGLANVDVNRTANELSKENWENAMEIQETDKGAIITVAIIVDVDVRTKVVAYEISSSVKNLMKKNNEKLSKLNIIVRGVK